jgi:hypothetical protein
VGFGLDRRARSTKAKGGLRALFGRAPDARELGDRLGRLAGRVLGGAVTDSSAKRVTLRLHRDAAPVRIAVLADGDLEVRGETASIGPGYYAYVIDKLAPLLAELDYAWVDAPADELAHAQEAHVAWLAGELRAGATRIGMPADLAFLVDAAVLTPMGPRDAAWRDAVLAEPRRGADAFAWWDRGPGRLARSRAALALSFEVPWREPVDEDELALMERADRDLDAARAADPALELPWAEWAELAANLGDDARAGELRARAAGHASVLGYRRYPMLVELGAWQLELAGAFVGSWEDDRYWATDGARMIELHAITTDGTHATPALLDLAPPRHPIIATFADEHRAGRAEAYDQGDLHIVHGLVAAAPEVAILTCKGARADEEWALATWRSLRPRE